MKNPPGAQAEIRCAAPIEAPGPGRMTGRIEFLRPLPFKHRFRFAIAHLLFPIRVNRIAPMMPNHRRGNKAQVPTGLLQPPADIHVIASNTKLRIESTYGLESGFAKG